MFQWLTKRIYLRRMIKARALLPYWDGSRMRHGDPFAIWRRLVLHPTLNYERLATEADEGKEPETSQCIELICQAFDVKRWDPATGAGLTDWQILNLPGQLARLIEDVKKNYGPGLNLPSATGSGSSTSPAAPADPTNPSSVSGA